MTNGFKEWALVCQALENGTSSVIIRKGGIAEGREGFRFKHQDFVLFPTLFHEQLEKTRLPSDSTLPLSTPGFVRISIRVEVEWTEFITNRLVLEKLEPFHILKPSVVEDRFVYDPRPGQTPRPDGVHLAFLRVWKSTEPWQLTDSVKYGGCRSWVELPDIPAGIRWTPTLSDESHGTRMKNLRAILSAS